MTAPWLLPIVPVPPVPPEGGPGGPVSGVPDLPGPTRWLLEAAGWAQHRPWLLAVAAAGLIGHAAGRIWLARWRHAHHAAGARVVTIAPPPEVDEHAAETMWANLAGTLLPSRRRRLLHGAPHVAWQYTWTGRRLLISVWVPGTVPPGAVEAAIRGAWPSVAVSTEPAAPPIPPTATAAVGGRLLPTASDRLPFADQHPEDPLRALIAAGAQLRPGEHACVQILARPATPRHTAKARDTARRMREGRNGLGVFNPAAPLLWFVELFLPGRSRSGTGGRPAPTAGRDPGVERDVRSVLDKTGGVLWVTGVRYAVASTSTRAGADPHARLSGVGSAIAASFAVHDGRNRLVRRMPMPAPATVLARRRLSGGFLSSGPELAAFAALPRDLAVPGLDRARAKAVPAPVAVPAGGRGMKVLGDAQVGGHTVALPVPDARFHTHMVGSTGSGKTTLLVNMALDDIRAGRGTVVIDPHGDLVLDILDRLPASAADRVVLIDPDQPNPPTINPLQGADPDLVTDNLVSIFGSIFQKAWGPRMDDVMRVACLTLLRRPNAATLQQIPPLLNSRQFRSAMTVDLDDPAGLGGFWVWYDELTPALRSQVIGPVLARLRAFLLRDFVAQVLRYPRASFDMGKVLDGGVLLVRIPKGVLGEDTSKLLGSLILAQVWQAATARARVPADRRRDASLIIDECQNFLTLANSLDTMLAEARKYRLALTLAHQDLAQFPRDLLAAASANARNKIYFACAPEDAKVLARHTLPELDEHDLTHLDAYHAAARLVVDGRQTPAFTLLTRPPRAPVGETAQIRRVVAANVPPQDTSEIDELVKKYSGPGPQQGDRDRQRRPKDTSDGSGTGRAG